MFVSFMYHGISHPNLPDAIERFKSHLLACQQAFTIGFPGEKTTQIGCCLTFDDAYFDFYHHVFPLLKQFQIKAVLAIPTQYILEDTSLSPQQRLELPRTEAMQGDNYQLAPFCTWRECREMQKSGWVRLASHSHSHADLTQTNDLEKEIHLSKQLIEQHCNTAVEDFIYPYGKWSASLQHQIKQQYRYTYRIGSAFNANWQQPIIYRINADPFWQQQQLFSMRDIIKFRGNYWLNRLRGK